MPRVAVFIARSTLLLHRCSRGVTGYNETSADESLGESARQNGDQQKTPSSLAFVFGNVSSSRHTIAVAFISLPSAVCV